MASSASPNDRAATGIAGLDQILGGGLPQDRVYLVETLDHQAPWSDIPLIVLAGTATC